MTPQENMLARHKILHELGRGATGAVYAARDRTTGAVVALKRLDPPLLKSDASLAGRFLKHARAARHLRHRNIVEIHDAGEAAGTAYVAMEMLEGESLRKILDDGPLPVARAIRIAHEIACGLAHAHLEGVLHGGVKPSNIIVLRSGAVKITDFGIGQLGHAALLSGARAGCLSYMSPEQVRGDPLDHRSDIFSLGALLYEMLARRCPFEGGSPKETMENIVRAKPPAPSELNQHVPRALDAIVLSMLAGQPAARMAGVPVLLGELQRLEEGLGLGSGDASAGTDAPAASVPPAEPEPRDASGFGVRPELSAADQFQHRQITDRELLEYDRAMRERRPGPERSSRSRPAIFAALALVLGALGIGFTGFADDWFTGFMDDWSGRIERGIAAGRMPEAPPTAAAPRPATPAPVAEAIKEPMPASSAPDPMPLKPPVAEPAPSAQTGTSIAREPEQPATTGAAPAQDAPRARKPTAKVAAAQPGGTARLILAVSPRGELYIDGEHHGTTPPVTTFDLEPGMHRIEVRSGSRKPYLTYMTVQAGDVRRIRHDFNAKPSRPPR